MLQRWAFYQFLAFTLLLPIWGQAKVVIVEDINGARVRCEDLAPQCPVRTCEDGDYLIGGASPSLGLWPIKGSLSAESVLMRVPVKLRNQQGQVLFANSTGFQYANTSRQTFFEFFRNHNIMLSLTFGLRACPQEFKSTLEKTLSLHSARYLKEIPVSQLQNLETDTELSHRRPQDMHSSQYSPWNKEELQQNFDVWKNSPSLRYDYLKDGCFARAEIIAQSMKAQGKSFAKIWAYGFGLWPAGVKKPENFLAWRYHVAPVTLVQTSQGAELRVLDPGLFPTAVKPSEWITKIMGPNAKITITNSIDETAAAKKMEVQVGLSGLDSYHQLKPDTDLEQDHLKNAHEVLEDLPSASNRDAHAP